MWAATVDGALLGHLGGDRLDDLDIEVGGGELDAVAFRLHQDVGQDRNGVAPFDHALHMVEGLEEGRSFDSHPHILAILSSSCA